jgi:drug/metabolite transporter (DMT)-like permease
MSGKLSPVIALRLILTTFFWGATFIAGKYLAQNLPHFTAAFLRFVFALAGLGLFAFVAGQKIAWPKKQDWLTLAALGASGVFIYNAGFFAALERIPASRAALIVAASPVVTLCAVQCLEGARWVATQVTGVCLSFLGAVIVVTHGHPLEWVRGGMGIGDVYILAAVLSWVVYTLLLRYRAQAQAPLHTSFWSVLCGLLMLAVPAAGEWNRMPHTLPPAMVWWALAYMGLIGTALSFVWYSQAVAVIGAARATQFTNLVPVFGVLLSALILGESIPWLGVAGGVLVLAGVMLVNWTSARATS